MKRAQNIKFYDPAQGRVIEKRVEFIASNLISGVALATGGTSYSFFSNPNTDTVANYIMNNVTPFRNGIGRALSLNAYLAGPALAEVPYGPAATRTAVEKLRNSGILQVNFGSDLNDYIMLKDLMPETPVVIQNVAAAENVAVGLPMFSNIAKPVPDRIYPLGDIPQLISKEAMTFTLTFASGNSVAAALNTYVLILEMRAEEWYPESVQGVRAA